MTKIAKPSSPKIARAEKPDKRQVRNGKPTNDLIFSAYSDGNDRTFPRILSLYVAPGSIVADVTFGKGVFWRRVPPDQYEVLATDINDGIDCRNLPYKDGTIDCVVLDPPYMHTPGGTAHEAHSPFEDHYRNNASGNRTRSKYHDAVLDLYRDAGREAYRVLRDRGVLIVKCQDEVCSNQQRFTHVEIMQMYDEMGLVAENRAGRLVRMAEGQAMTYKLTKKLADMRPIETLPADLRTLLDLS